MSDRQRDGRTDYGCSVERYVALASALKVKDVLKSVHTFQNSQKFKNRTCTVWRRAVLEDGSKCSVVCGIVWVRFLLLSCLLRCAGLQNYFQAITNGWLDVSYHFSII